MGKIDKRRARNKQKHFFDNRSVCFVCLLCHTPALGGESLLVLRWEWPVMGLQGFWLWDSGEGVETLHHPGWRAESLRRSVLLSLIKWSSAAGGQRPPGLPAPFLNQYCTAVVKGTGFVSQFLSTFPLSAPPPCSVISWHDAINSLISPRGVLGEIRRL